MSDRIATDSSKPRENFDFENLNLSFNGCGFLGVYHSGVACALSHYLPNMKIKNICGASAGAMVSVCLIAGIPPGKYTVLQKYRHTKKILEIRVVIKILAHPCFPINVD
jgi:predicted acylesterase/phospholipase RssA